MTVEALKAKLDRLGVILDVRLVVEAPAGVLTPALKARLAEHKAELVFRLAQEATPPRPAPEADSQAVGPPQNAPAALVGWPPRRPELATWSIRWRERFNTRASELKSRGARWNEAESRSFAEAMYQRLALGLGSEGWPNEPGPPVEAWEEWVPHREKESNEPPGLGPLLSKNL